MKELFEAFGHAFNPKTLDKLYNAKDPHVSLEDVTWELNTNLSEDEIDEMPSVILLEFYSPELDTHVVADIKVTYETIGNRFKRHYFDGIRAWAFDCWLDDFSCDMNQLYSQIRKEIEKAFEHLNV